MEIENDSIPTRRLPRRTALLIMAAAGASLAGCTSSGSPGGTETSTVTKEESTVAEFKAELDSNGIDVQDVMSFPGGDKSVIYTHTATKNAELTAFAESFAPHFDIVSNTLAVTASENGDRWGTFHVERRWGREFLVGTISESEYVRRIEGTFEYHDGGGS